MLADDTGGRLRFNFACLLAQLIVSSTRSVQQFVSEFVNKRLGARFRNEDDFPPHARPTRIGGKGARRDGNTFASGELDELRMQLGAALGAFPVRLRWQR